MVYLNCLGDNGCVARPHRSSGKHVLSSLIMLFFLTGCSFLEPSWNYDESISDDLIILGAERRVIFFSDKGVLHENPVGKSGSIDAGNERLQYQNRPKVICAEPSPDVVTQLALSGGMKALIQPGNSTEANLAIAAAALRLSNRTQTIQLLRDGLYRACEAYFNGVLGEDEYKNIIKGYDELLITLVAIEGLTSMDESGRSLSLMVAAQSDSPETNPMPSGNDRTPSDVEPDKFTPLNADKKAMAMVSTSRYAAKGQTVGVGDLVAAKIQKIVRDYYCFQLGLKEKFYPASKGDDKKLSTKGADGGVGQARKKKKAKKVYGPFSHKVLDHLCGGNGDVEAGASLSMN